MTQASDRARFRVHGESLGKCGLHESGKDWVNEIPFVIPGCAEGAGPESMVTLECWEKWSPGSRFARPGMTSQAWLATALPIAACAAASRAIGTR